MDEIYSGLGSQCENCGHCTDMPAIAKILNHYQQEILSLHTELNDMRKKLLRYG